MEGSQGDRLEADESQSETMYCLYLSQRTEQGFHIRKTGEEDR